MEDISRQRPAIHSSRSTKSRVGPTGWQKAPGGNRVTVVRSFALAVPNEQALLIRDDVGFFQAVRSVLTKGAPSEGFGRNDIDVAIRQIISRAVPSDEVIDIFAAAGLKKPEIGILTEEFLAQVKGMPQKNLAVELLQKLLGGEIRTRGKHNVIQARSFAEMLENAIKKYQNRAIETVQVIEELIGLARDIREADKRGDKLGLTPDEVAFYDALGVNDSAVKVLGDATLRVIAQELVRVVKENVKIDWTVRENVRAQMRVMIKRILRKYGYPPDKQAKATELVLEQAEDDFGRIKSLRYLRVGYLQPVTPRYGHIVIGYSLLLLTRPRPCLISPPRFLLSNLRSLDPSVGLVL